MKRKLSIVAGLSLLAACGGSPDVEPPPEPACTLPDCSRIETITQEGSWIDFVGLAARGALVLRSAPGSWDDLALVHVAIDTGVETVLGEGVHAGSVRIAGDRVLFVREARERGGLARGALELWSPEHGVRPVAEDVRAGWYDACGDWVWFWHGDGAAVNCAPVAAANLETGDVRDLGESCDLAGEVARFDERCSVLVTGEGRGELGVGLHGLHSGITRHAGAEGATGNVTGFQLSPNGALLAVQPRGALNLVDTAREGARTIAPEGGAALAFSPDSRELLFTTGGKLHRLPLHTEGAAPVAVAEVGLIASAVYAPDGQRIAFIDVRNGEPARLRMLDRDTGVVTDLAEAAHRWWYPDDLADHPAPRLQPLAFAGGGRWLLYFTRRYGEPLRLEVWDVAKGESRVLSDDVRANLTIGGLWPSVAVDQANGLVAWIGDGGLRLASLHDGNHWKVAEDAVLPHFGYGHLVWSDFGTIFSLPVP